jgi:hypothetical protein
MHLLKTSALFVAFVSTLVAIPKHSFAQGKPCRQGLKGVYVTWSKNSSAIGAGSFQTPYGRVAVLPGFTWEVTGMSQSISVATNEPFSGGNSMKGFYGDGESATNLNVRIQQNNATPGAAIPHSALLTIRFNANTPASGGGF